MNKWQQGYSDGFARKIYQSMVSEYLAGYTKGLADSYSLGYIALNIAKQIQDNNE
jgi:hypothetical protein